MNWINVAAYGAAILGAALLIAVHRRMPQPVEGRVVLRYSTSFRIFALLAVVLPFLLTSKSTTAQGEELLTIWVMTLAFWAFWYWLILEFWGVEISFDDQFIYAVSPWVKPRQIPWDNIVSNSFWAAVQWYVFHTKDHGDLIAPTGLNGIQKLLDAIVLHSGGKKPESS